MGCLEPIRRGVPVYIDHQACRAGDVPKANRGLMELSQERQLPQVRPWLRQTACSVTPRLHPFIPPVRPALSSTHYCARGIVNTKMIHAG